MTQFSNIKSYLTYVTNNRKGFWVISQGIVPATIIHPGWYYQYIYCMLVLIPLGSKYVIDKMYARKYPLSKKGANHCQERIQDGRKIQRGLRERINLRQDRHTKG